MGDCLSSSISFPLSVFSVRNVNHYYLSLVSIFQTSPLAFCRARMLPCEPKEGEIYDVYIESCPVLSCRRQCTSSSGNCRSSSIHHIKDDVQPTTMDRLDCVTNRRGFSGDNSIEYPDPSSDLCRINVIPRQTMGAIMFLFIVG